MTVFRVAPIVQTPNFSARLRILPGAGNPDGSDDFSIRLGYSLAQKYGPGKLTFDELSDAISKGTADSDELSEIANKYSMEVLGPVPEGYV